MIRISNIEPNNLLSSYIKKYSFFESTGKINYKQKLTPSAFTYLSYNHLDIPESIIGGEKIQPSNRLQITGPKINEPFYVGHNGFCNQILIEFTASGFYYLFHHSPKMINNKLLALSEFTNTETSGQLEYELLKTNNHKERISILESFLLDLLPKALPFIDYIEKTIHNIEICHGSIQINKLTKEINISERQLNRKFLEIVGLPPKLYCKLTQLHYVIEIMQSKRYSSIKDISNKADYYDLSHFDRHFKDLTGFTPNEFIQSDEHIALKYFNDI